MSSLLNSLSSTAGSAEPLYAADSPGMIDHHVVDAPYAQHVASAVDSQFVDPMTFIDELLASSSSPGFSPLPESPLFSPMSMHSPGSVSRKRSFDDAMF
ncbi:hypothetical protein GGI21_002172 [Coemansia aciculifera]|nr:hypothetical protein GGI21_002172 [Coemansia aciculifera]